VVVPYVGNSEFRNRPRAATLLFKAADKDGDGTVDAEELHTKAGIKLDRVIE
jgi:hypothetical protein